MSTMVKLREPIPCGICKATFTPPYPFERLCAKCRKTLPQCDNCGSVMCDAFGYKEQFACKVGKYRICWGCKNELHNKGYLRPSEAEKLLPSGKVVKVRPALRVPPHPVKKKAGATKAS